ncbi:Uncharacterized protein OS=Lyngbya aestuarii BL J GN=M595_2435 PE=4 SV=1: HATPase_c_3 [Gemmata massiliana]|uniref:Uncharacterized protein n=2 Tax=Gemmata massiliana TaxID=1210884 RepID=A0A6P2D074_9BACT|nr:Uncharacterized protein OS=Lyngbya aestuarii BL J GN=M595_2435 PE=4 SV=1: HATPase_c_3 [Gemmata massiliana]
MHPEQSFEHVLREISVNRADPCELIRELISNSYDAGARNVYISPLYQHRGLLYFDDGCGLSQTEADKTRGVLPYVAFFSIGKGTKTAGSQIGYKCQGAKLCFAAKRFSLITRCRGEAAWRWKSIDNPKSTLNEKYDISPAETTMPWQTLADNILKDADNLTQPLLEHFAEPFFRGSFLTGLMIVIQDFEVDDFEKYFSLSNPHSYLLEYVKHYTAHADVRRISSEPHGFRDADVLMLQEHIASAPVSLRLWVSVDKPRFEVVSAGWPYLAKPKAGSPYSAAKSPEEVPRLRDGTFHARHAESFRHEGRLYNLILAIDGKRRALDEYTNLSRQNATRSGVSFSDQRGLILSCLGVRVCQYNQFFDHAGLGTWQDLNKAIEHFTFFIDGPLDLVTNRNYPAQTTLTLLRDAKFVAKVVAFLDRAASDAKGTVLKELLNRVKREATAHKEEEYVAQTLALKTGLAARAQFCAAVPDCTPLSTRWFVEPSPGEEHFVGALYTMFASVVGASHALQSYWTRPLTFKARGIDALACGDEGSFVDPKSTLCIEYKYSFTSDNEYNHPLTVTDRIVCWHLDDLQEGLTVQDSFGYRANVGKAIAADGKKIGVELNDIRHTTGGRERDKIIPVVSLRNLLTASFDVKWRPPVMAPDPAKKKKAK